MHGMRPFGALLPKEEALAKLMAAAVPVQRSEVVPLERAAGRVAAEEIRALFPVPPFARSTMDGYAVRAEDTLAPNAELRIIADIYAGASRIARLGYHEAMRIATGAPVPAGADAVVRVEDTSESDGVVTVRVAVRKGQSIEPAGTDLAARDLVVADGALLTPARLGLVASVGLAQLRVRAKPRVAVLPTGDELLRPGAPRDPMRIYDSNSTTLSALAEASGALVTRGAPLPDELGALTDALREAASTHDAVVISGGASAGAKDLVVDALAKLGEVLFHGVRVKPGKPLLAARVGSCLVVGLPGNPTSALSNACLFVAPALRRMAGLPPAAPVTTDAPLAVDVKGEAERYLFLPVRIEDGRVVPTFKGSGALTSLAASDGWIGVPERGALPAGSRVSVHAWW